MKKAMMFLAMMLAGVAMSSPVKSNVAGETIIRNGENLPYDAEVEYLESTGTQYIDTGVMVTSGDRVDCTFALGGLANTTVCGARRNSSFYSFAIWAYTLNETNIRYDYIGINGSGNGRPLVLGGTPVVGQYYTVAKIGAQNYLDGTEIESNIINPPYTPYYSLYLFAMNNGGAASFIGSLRIKRCSIGGKRDFIPVRFTNEQGVSEGAMYDRLGTGGMNPDGSPRTDGLYRNRGTGAFLVGPDKR